MNPELQPPSSSSSSSTSLSTSTILSTLHTLLSTSPLATSSPYLHPYSPSSDRSSFSSARWRAKGKGREFPTSNTSASSIDEYRTEQSKLLNELKEGLETGRQVLASAGAGVGAGSDTGGSGPGGKGAGAGAVGGDERERVVRAMKEVIAHQSTLLPLIPHLFPSSSHSQPDHSSSSSLYTGLEPPVPPLPLVELLTTLSARAGIETYLEDSQFGLLKTSLALAGKRFVVDVDVEMDGAEGDAEEDEAPLIAFEGVGGVEGRSGERDADDHKMEGRGRTRLSKLHASHVIETESGSSGTGKSDWVAGVLRVLVEEYLDAWNSEERPEVGGDKRGSLSRLDDQLRAERWERLELIIGQMGKELEELSWLDGMSEAAMQGAGGDVGGTGGGGANDQQGESERRKKRDWFGQLEEKAGVVQDLIKEGTLHSASRTIFPSFNLLPTDATSASSNTRSRLCNPTFRLRPARPGEDVPDPLSVGSVQESSKGRASDWILEYVQDEYLGLPVRRNWLDRERNPEGEDGMGNVAVEQLLYGSPFPYGATFGHVASKGQAGLEQRWSMATPGPAGFVIGRLGTDGSASGLQRLSEVLRVQVIWNAMFSSVCTPAALSVNATELDDGDDIDLDDLMSAPSAFPITITLRPNSVRASMPLPHALEAIPPTLTLNFTAPIQLEGKVSNQLDVSWNIEPPADEMRTGVVEAAVQEGRKGGWNLVDVLGRIERSLAA